MPIGTQRETPAHSAARPHEGVPIEPEAASEASLVPGVAGAGETRPDIHSRGFALTWLVPLALVLVATASSVYLRGSPSAAVPACAAGGWPTELTLDRPRPPPAT